LTSDLREQLQKALGAAYEIDRELGGGGMSRVFVARETSLGRDVVVKVLPPELAGELSAERFRREIQLAARLQHPHIVPVLSACAWNPSGNERSEETLLFYMMPLIEGETLRARLQRTGELPVSDVVRIGRELADALAHAHERGVVHRDLKPENILVTRGHALVADFGVAKAVDASALSTEAGRSALTSIGLALGTPTYMAPEQAAGDPATDHRADLYALGCVLYELLAGTPPFSGRPAQALLAAHIAEAPEPIGRRRPATPASLAALVMRLLEKRPADRPQTADEVLDLLQSMGTIATPAADSVPAMQPATAAVSASAPASAAATEPIGGAPRKSMTAWRLGIAGGVVAGLALVAVLVTSLAGKRTSRADPAGPVAIAIIDADEGKGSGQLENLETVVRNHLTDALSTIDRARAVGNAAEARFTIATSAEPIGRDSALIRARLTDVAAGKVLRAFAPARVSVADPAAGLDRLRSRVQGAIGVVLHQMLGAGALPSTDSPSAEVFAEFSTALVEVERVLSGLGQSQKSAADHLSRAIAMDSSYAQPLIWRAFVASGEGFSGRRSADSIVSQLLATRGDKLTAYERSLAELMRSSARGDVGAAVRESERLFRMTPVEWTGQAYGRALNRAGRYRAAAVIMDSIAAGANPDDPQFWNDFARALHALGDHARELAVARRAVRLMPDRVGVRTFEIRALIALDSGDAALKRLEDALMLPEERDASALNTVVRRIRGFAQFASEFRAHGEEARAIQLERRVAAELSAARIENLDRTNQLELLGAALLLRLDSVALSLVRRLSTGDTAQQGVGGQYGVALARAGDTAAAEREMKRLEALGHANAPYTQGADLTARARIAAALGRSSEAIALASLAIAQGNGETLRRIAHTAPEFATLRRNPDFQRLIRPRED